MYNKRTAVEKKNERIQLRWLHCLAGVKNLPEFNHHIRRFSSLPGGQRLLAFRHIFLFVSTTPVYNSSTLLPPSG